MSSTNALGPMHPRRSVFVRLKFQANFSACLDRAKNSGDESERTVRRKKSW